LPTSNLASKAWDPTLTERSDGTWTSRTYDRAGNLVRATTEATDLTLTYDVLNRLQSEKLAIKGSSFSKTVFYQYDEESHISSVTDPEGRTITYGYDLAEQLGTVSSTTQGLMVQVGWDGYGQRGTIGYANGNSGTFLYDKNGRPSSIDWTAPVLELGYLRDPAGNPTQIQEMVGGTAETLGISYDDLGRPTVSTALNMPIARSESFSYDLSGNPINPGTGVTTTFNAANQPVSSGTTSFTYDARGNRTAAIPSSGPKVETIHDPGNRPVIIRNGASETRIVYDGLDRVVEIRDAGAVTRISYAVRNRLCEYDGAGNLIEQYTSGPELDDVFAVEKPSGVFYLHRDAVGSIRTVTDGSGVVVGTRAYGLFGRLLGTTGSDGVGLGYTGRPFYLGGDLVDLRARL